MKSSQKMVVTGSLGGLAAVAVLGSAAFACTADATVGVIQNDAMQVNAAVPAGQPFTFKVKSFMPATFEKDAQGNEVMVEAREIAVNLISPFTGEVKELGRYAGPEATVRVPGTILENAYDSGSDKPYVLQAVQAGSYTKSSNIYVTNGRQFVPAASTASTSTNTSTGAPASTAPANQATTSVGAPVRGVVAAPAAAGNAAAAPAAADVKAPTAQASAAAPALAAPASAAPDAIVPLVPSEIEITAPPAAALWSGLEGGSATNLLDQATSTTAPSDGVPAGAAALLGLGILSLAGVAFEASRRRLVVARVASRR